MLFITHDFGVVSEIADRVVVMRLGSIVEQVCASSGEMCGHINRIKKPHSHE